MWHNESKIGNFIMGPVYITMTWMVKLMFHQICGIVNISRYSGYSNMVESMRYVEPANAKCDWVSRSCHDEIKVSDVLIINI